jgi:hypothetical protein
MKKNHEELWLEAYLAEITGGTTTSTAPRLADFAVFEYNKRFPSGAPCMWENCPCDPKKEL